MGKSVARYDGSSAHYVLSRTLLGLSHYQFSRHAFNNTITCSEYGFNSVYHDSDDRSDRYKYNRLGLTSGRNGYMVGRCNYDLWNTYGYGKLHLHDSLNGRLWHGECNGYDYGKCCLCSCCCIDNTNTDGEYSFNKYYTFNDECNGHRYSDWITCWSYGCLVW